MARAPKTLGYQTELRFARFDGDVVDRGDYFVVSTPASPLATWRELGAKPGSEKQVLAWNCKDAPPGDSAAIAKAAGTLGMFVEEGRFAPSRA